MGSTSVDIELELEIEFDYSPGSPAVMHLSNGDPGYPAEAEELQVTRAFVWGKDDKGVPKIIDLLDSLTDEQVEAIERDILENLDGDEPDEEER